MKNKIYVGILPGLKREIFRYHKTPEHSDGLPYNAVIGPFRTVRGAQFSRDFGQGNPHCVTVAQAEQLGKKYACGLKYSQFENRMNYIWNTD